MFRYLAPPLPWIFNALYPPYPCNCPISVTSWENSRVHESCHAEVCQYKQENESIVHWDGWGDGFCQPGAPVEKTSSAVTLRFFPLTSITQSSTLPPSHAARLNLQCYRNFHGDSFGDHCSTLCKAALFQSTESTDCSQGSQSFATLLPYLQPGVLLLCVKASPIVAFLLPSLQPCCSWGYFQFSLV